MAPKMLEKLVLFGDNLDEKLLPVKVDDGVANKACEMDRCSDVRMIIFAAKMGLALIIMLLLIFLKEPFNKDISRNSVWAILTVVVVFEFSIGATLSKGFNRGLGTLSAGGLAVGMGELSALAGEWEEVIVIISTFIVGFCATYAKLYPTLKPYEYGFRVFLITYCYITVSGYHSGEFLDTSISRFVLIALGAVVSLGVNICIYPIWAGEDLHNLVIKNFMGVATSLEGVVDHYLNCVEYKKVSYNILTYQAAVDAQVYSGYISAVESTSNEDSLVGFAVWEPPHGKYKMLKYPWKNYVKVSGALRHCAYMVMAMHGCILSEIQAPADKRRIFCNELKMVCSEGAHVLRELGNKVQKMEKLDRGDLLYKVHEAAEELQQKINKKSYLLVNSELWEIGNRPREETDDDHLEGLINMDEDRKFLQYKSLSESVLDLRSIEVQNDWDGKTTDNKNNHDVPAYIANENMFVKQMSWPSHVYYKAEAKAKVEESKTYYSASSLSLTTFTSLLIEFVARLQNLVDTIEELGEKANFKDPHEQKNSAVASAGAFWTRLLNCFKS